MLHRQHRDNIERQKITVALWAMHRMAVKEADGHLDQPSLWRCRGCKKAFRSKGGLGAHLFKTHGRVATVR